ncbi:MAG: hypothetical protein F4Z14_11460 [Gammaproteobacteria bacterium]|nr:hypothetical protein [Gammaproteobacteria bacterium]
MSVNIYSHGIAAWLSRTAHENAFAQLTQFSQIHETFHVGQIKAIYDATKALPKPYKWWELEVEAHRGSGKLWQGMYGRSAGTPTLLPLETPENKARKEAYDTMADRYKAIEKKKEDGTITATEEAEMDGLEKDLKDPSKLPQGETSGWWDPDEIDLECDWEDK